MGMIFVAALGVLVPGGLFLYWLAHGYTTLSAALSDRLAMAFVADMFGTTALLAYLFARRPPGPIKWPWFIVVSLLSTLWSGIAIYLWLNWRRAPEPRPGFAAWWRSVS